MFAVILLALAAAGNVALVVVVADAFGPREGAPASLAARPA